MKEKITVEVSMDLEDLIPQYLEEQQQNIQRILNALESGDFHTIEGIGHGYAGTGGGYGFQFITECGQKIEIAAKKQDQKPIRELSQKLATYLESVEVEYIDDSDDW